jgi:hypothetical protein
LLNIDSKFGAVGPSTEVDNFSNSAECLKALFVTDAAVDRTEIETRKDKLMASSCDWVLGIFDEFDAEDSALVFWLHGPPGKGKTMIAMALVDHISQKLSREGHALLGYFFCDNTASTRNTLLNVLKTLVRQVLVQLLLQKSAEALDFLREFSSKGLSMFSSVEAVWLQIRKILP